MASPRIVLGVTGGIAAYKSAEIVRGLVRAGAGVTVVMTENACRFITELTLQTLSGRRVITSSFEPPPDDAAASDVEHIGLARDTDLFLVAPATAAILAKMAAGIADDFLTTFHLALTCPILVAPAMNPRMWAHPAVVENVARLRARGVHLIGPDDGEMASLREGTGIGRLASPESIVVRSLALAGGGTGAEVGGEVTSLCGRRVLVTAGPTREELDPVRYLSNPSTGRMGFAVARAARELGGEVTLVAGPTHLDPPEGVNMIHVTSAEQMRESVLANVGGADLVVMTAAVSDFRPVRREPKKVRKDAAALTLELERTPDILAEVAASRHKAFLVGFAAETGAAEAGAAEKLQRKGIDLIVANDVSAEGIGFGSEENEVTVIERGSGVTRWPRLPKIEIARRLLALVAGKLPS